MKKITTLLLALFLVVAIQGQTLQSIFDKYGDDERFEYVSIGKGMMNIGSVFGGVAKNEKEMMSKMRNIKILTLEAAANSTIMKTIVNDLDKVLQSGGFETAIEVRDKGERVNIYYRVDEKENADMLIITKEKGELSIIWINGKMSKQEMMKSFSNNRGNGNSHSNKAKTIDTIVSVDVIKDKQFDFNFEFEFNN